MMINQLKPYFISLLVGLLVGIERENSKPNQKTLGIRTFLLLSLLGALSGELRSTYLPAFISIFAFALILASYSLQRFSKTEELHLGLTTEFAAGVVYVAGFLSHQSPLLATILGPIVAIILVSKTTLHRFTQSINTAELKAAIAILLIGVVVIELAPTTAIDPWGIFIPRKFGYLVLTLACLEFLSYISYKFAGEKTSSLIVGLLGGLVSSTVVLVSTAKQARSSEDRWRSLAITTVAAQLASMAELLLIVVLVSPTLFLQVAIATLPLLVGGGLSIFVMKKKVIESNSIIEMRSPLDWKGVFRLSVLFSLVLGLISAAERWLGSTVTLVLSFLTGLFELQGISVANATLYAQDQMSLQSATHGIIIAIAASLISKIAIAWFFGRNKFSLCMTVIFVPMIVIVIAVGSLL